MSMEEIFATFIAESHDRLAEMEQSLFELEKSPEDPELLNGVFRAIHTIKGSAGMFSLDVIVSFTHVAENVLDEMRNGRIAVDADLVNDLLQVIDTVKDLVDRAARKSEMSTEEPGIKRLIGVLEQRLGNGEPTISAQSDQTDGADTLKAANWHLSLRFGAEVARNGNDPLALLRYLASVGEVIHVEAFETGSLEPEGYDPLSVLLGFDIRLRAATRREELLAIFEWVASESHIEVIGPNPGAGDFLAVANRLAPDERDAAVKRWVACGSVDVEAMQERLQSTVVDHPTKKVAAKAPGKTPTKAAPLSPARSESEARFIRVDARRLDKLINLVGELVIAGSGAQTLALQSGREELIEASSVILELVEDVRDSSLSLRTVPVETMFSRFTRVVRELSHDLGKEIEISFDGGDTELDRSLIERVSDPMVHLVRNAADHGLESPDDRVAAGKSRAGHIHLCAYYDSGSVVIEIRDDGRGIDLEAVRRKAIDAGLIRADQLLTEDQTYDLLFHSGFSTASQVTNVSGRGVGLDVVRKNLTQIRGSVEVTSEAGKGSLFRLRLPLTLAIIDGFLVSVADEKYVIPVDMIRECIEAPQCNDVALTCDYFNLRGAVMPYVRLRGLFGSGDERGIRENLVVAQYGDRVAGLMVDELLGESQTVIKPLGRLFSGVPGIGGATILGTGEVALILDIPALMGELGGVSPPGMLEDVA